MSVVKDFLDKHGGGLLTGVVLALLGCMTQQYLAGQAELDRKARLYSELMSRREEAESELRSEMFNSILEASLPNDQRPPTVSAQLFHLELLVGNFHESLNLAPMFWRLTRLIQEEREPATRERHRVRLAELAQTARDKQLMALAGRGTSQEFPFWFRRLGESAEVLDPDAPIVSEVELPTTLAARSPSLIGSMPLALEGSARGGDGSAEAELHLIAVDQKHQRLRIQLRLGSVFQANSPLARTDIESLDPERWVSFFDFPMIENLRLWKGYRCAIVLKELELPAEDQMGFARLAVLEFPASYASLKERPFLQDVLDELQGSDPPDSDGEHWRPAEPEAAPAALSAL